VREIRTLPSTTTGQQNCRANDAATALSLGIMPAALLGL